MFQLKAPLTKDQKKVYDNILKIKKTNPFYICVRKEQIDYISLGRTDIHHFTITQPIKISQQFIIQRIDLESFKLAITLFKNNMVLEIALKDEVLLVQQELQTHTQTGSYTSISESSIPLLIANDIDMVKQILDIPNDENLIVIEFQNPLQFKILSQQLRALKVQRVQFQVIPEQSSIRVQSVFHGDGQLTMKYFYIINYLFRYIFNNYKILQTNIKENEKFTFDSEEFSNSIAMIEKEEAMIFKLQGNGSLLLCDSQGITKSILSRIIMHEDF